MPDIAAAVTIVDPQLFALQVAQLNTRIDDANRLTIERFAAAKEALATALTASQQAIDKADISTEKRLDTMNEFRASLSDQNREFVRLSEYSVSHKTLADKSDLTAARLTSVESDVRNKLSSTYSGPGILIGMLSVLVAIVIALVGGAISLGSLQTNVSIGSANIEKLQNAETKRIVEHAGENVERGNLQTRQALNDERIKQLESNGYIKPPDVAALVERIAKLEIEVKNGQPNK